MFSKKKLRTWCETFDGTETKTTVTLTITNLLFFYFFGHLSRYLAIDFKDCSMLWQRTCSSSFQEWRDRSFISRQLTYPRLLDEWMTENSNAFKTVLEKKQSDLPKYCNKWWGRNQSYLIWLQGKSAHPNLT